MLGALTAPAQAADSPEALELQVKAAFLYNFAKFVQWPEDAQPAGAGGSLAFCVFYSLENHLPRYRTEKPIASWSSEALAVVGKQPPVVARHGV